MSNDDDDGDRVHLTSDADVRDAVAAAMKVGKDRVAVHASFPADRSVLWPLLVVGVAAALLFAVVRSRHSVR